VSVEVVEDAIVVVGGVVVLVVGAVVVAWHADIVEFEVVGGIDGAVDRGSDGG